MITVFQSVSSFFKVNKLCVDNNIFRLHYKFTTGALVLCAIVVSAYQFFGEPIKCLKTDVRQEVVETFCWAHSTYSLPDAFDKKYGIEVPYPGVDNSVRDGKYRPKVYHQYYQWVCFILLLQAVLFRAPHYLWKAYENERIKQIVLDLDAPIMEKDVKEKNKSLLVQYLKERLKLHKPYFFVYALCEVLNFVNVVGQILLTDKFLGHAFTKYGIEIIKYTETDISKRPDEMTRVFPKMTKCTFYVSGPTADVEKKDVLCILPLNVINEKIYAFMWFWFIILATVTAGLLVHRILILSLPQARYLLLVLRCSRVDKNDLHTVLSQSDIGDWFILDLLAKNLQPNNFKDVVSDLAREIHNQGKKNLMYIHNGNSKLSGIQL